MCLTETLLKPELDELCIPNYRLYRHDRLHKKWGGVGVLVRDHFKSNPIILGNSSFRQIQTLSPFSYKYNQAITKHF